jgi:hypothetical protein
MRLRDFRLLTAPVTLPAPIPRPPSFPTLRRRPARRASVRALAKA